MRVRESLKHYIRDWSVDVLRAVDIDARAGQRVLVPGAGLGRRGWEIPELGFLETTAVELSFLMNLEALFRSIRLLDVVPRLSSALKLLEADFLTLKTPPAPIIDFLPVPGHDFIVTLFFIDISLSILTTLEHIYYLLRPGGTWINPGPLLWTAASGGQSKLELRLQVVLQTVEELGFIIDPPEDGQRTTTVECEYTGDAQAMMR
ncbi:N2227-like protein-domain-containing protein [Favolaschia claudopus]|uniref:N2227-like protein-domain-containing protein n=1 Tax=Favolaschia claudopus TaxID=2862362 RepID=A0AAW0CYA5_9AGAR